MFSPESRMESPAANQAKNPFHGVRRMARKGMGFPKLGLAEQGMPDLKMNMDVPKLGMGSPDIAGGAQPGQQAGTLFGSFGNQSKGFRAPKF